MLGIYNFVVNFSDSFVKIQHACFSDIQLAKKNIYLDGWLDILKHLVMQEVDDNKREQLLYLRPLNPQ